MVLLVFFGPDTNTSDGDTNTMALTDVRCRTVKPGTKPQKLSDGEGLFLLVQPNGSKLWRLAYRFLGKQKALALGSYPRVTLGEARRKRDEAKRLLADGIDPGAERKRQKLTAKLSAETTFRAVADEWLAKLEREGRADVTVAKKRWLLSLVERDLGDRPVAELTPPEVLAALRRIEARGRHESAGRARATIGAVCRYAIATGRAENDPTQSLRGALITPKVKHHAAVTDPDGIGALLRALDAYEGAPQVEAALKLLPLLFCRPGELRAAEWSEFDLDGAVWTIPAARTKMRRPHRVPLSTQALAILRAAPSDHRRRRPRLSKRPVAAAVHQREHDQRDAAPDRLPQGRDDLARLPVDGRDPPQ